MNKPYRKCFSLLILPALFVGGGAYATPTPTESLPKCNVADVKVTSITIAGEGSVFSGAANAAECVGAYVGNATPIPTTNLGYYEDGLFNGAPQGGAGTAIFPSGIFPSLYTAIDLNNDGQIDPGWIMLGKWEPISKEDPTFTFKPSLIGGTDTIVLSNWFSATGTGSSGTWSFTPDADVVSRVLPILGANLFDQFALSFMAGDRFAAYDFTGAQFGMPTSPDVIYNFSGTWDMSRTLLNNGGQAAGLSHIDLYVRDPNGNDVPEPASLALLGLALAGLGFAKRKRS